MKMEEGKYLHMNVESAVKGCTDFATGNVLVCGPSRTDQSRIERALVDLACC